MERRNKYIARFLIFFYMVQNVYSCRIALNNEIHLLLITKRDIKKGEMLAYDYNGYKKQYPTEHFI